jgi:hypothetical protein
MKQLLVTLALALGIAFCCKAQQKSKPSNLSITLSPSLGFLLTGERKGTQVTMPAIGISGDIALSEKLTAGPYLAYVSSKEPSFGSYLTYSTKLLGVRVTNVFNENEKLDIYGMGLLGLNATTVANGDKSYKAKYMDVLWGAAIGARYHFSPKLAAFAEAGYSITILTAGISFKLN